MERRRDDIDLVAELRALRPTPRAGFTEELDARAAAGFPSRRLARADDSLLARLWAGLVSLAPRRLLVPAGAVGVLAIVVATAVVLSADEDAALIADRPAPGGGAPASSDRVGSSAAGDRGRQTEYAGEVPTVGESATSGAAPAVALPPGPRSGPYAARADRREVERSASIVLGVEPEAVRSTARRVFDAVHAVDGIVLRSSIREGAAGEAGGRFELLIPGGRLGDALAALSAIGEVVSRREASADITAPTVSARESLQDSRARIESLLGQLADAETEGERVSTEAKLRSERARSAALRSRLSSLQRRANFARVQLRIETGAASRGDGEQGAWGLGDGLDDAGRVLAIAAGVTIVALAVAAPFLALALLAWVGHRAWLRRRREHALS